MPIWLALASSLLGHNPDTSYARIVVAPDRIETRLTYDVFTLLKITKLDDNGDGQLQRSELSAHAPALADFLRSKTGLAVSDEDESADLGEFTGFVWPPDVGDEIAGADLHSAIGLIHFDFLRPLDHPPEVAAIAFGFFDFFSDRHTVLGVFECRGDKYETSFTAYEDYFEYATGYEPATLQTRHTLGERMWRFFKMGVEHIFLGYDHICFLIALIVVSRLGQILKIVTSFTIAHSITLILAALDVVHLPTWLVETAIAATVVYVAVENVCLHIAGRRRSAPVPGFPTAEAVALASRPSPFPHRWLLTFFFGLIHGFGFANVLRELGLPPQGLIQCLLAFNVGVEVGQVAIALCLLPFAYALNHWRYGRIAIIAISLLLAFFGAAWFIDRLFALDWLQRFGV